MLQGNTRGTVIITMLLIRQVTLRGGQWHGYQVAELRWELTFYYTISQSSRPACREDSSWNGKSCSGQKRSSAGSSTGYCLHFYKEELSSKAREQKRVSPRNASVWLVCPTHGQRTRLGLLLSASLNLNLNPPKLPPLWAHAESWAFGQSLRESLDSDLTFLFPT